jgi:hypothetical protein
MTDFAFVTHAAEMSKAAAAYTPTNMLQFGQDLEKLPDAFRDIANALRVSVQRAEEEFPVDPRVLEVLVTAVTVQNKVADLLEPAAAAFKRLHQSDLHRHEAPRVGEHLWNV